MTSKFISKHIDFQSTELSAFTLVMESPFSSEEIQKLKDLGGELKYDNGIMALILIPPSNIEEFAKIESILEIR